MWRTSLEKRLGREWPLSHFKLNVCFVCLKQMQVYRSSILCRHLCDQHPQSTVQCGGLRRGSLAVFLGSLGDGKTASQVVFLLSAVLEELLSLNHCIQIISEPSSWSALDKNSLRRQEPLKPAHRKSIRI